MNIKEKKLQQIFPDSIQIPTISTTSFTTTTTTTTMAKTKTITKTTTFLILEIIKINQIKRERVRDHTQQIPNEIESE